MSDNICQCPVCGRSHQELTYRDDKARLIAAAPDMLAALLALERQALQSDVNKPSNEWGREALAMTRAAITKATPKGRDERTG